jgi:DNA-binding NarL/FixJ family response regulator
MTRLRVLLADDHAVLRAGLRVLINSQPDMEVVGEAATGEEAWRQTGATRPDIVLLDLAMPGTGGIEAIGRIVRDFPGARIVILTMHDDVAYLRSALAAGASSYVLKRSADTELLSAIRVTHRGGTYLEPSLAGDIVDDALGRRGRPGDNAARDPLSDREREVLRLVAQGHTNQQIAERLSLSVKTVETYRARLMTKLGLRTRADLVRYALSVGLLSQG